MPVGRPAKRVTYERKYLEKQFHEFRNCLQILLTMSVLLPEDFKSQQRNDEEIIEDLKILYEAAERMADAVEDMASYMPQDY